MRDDLVEQRPVEVEFVEELLEGRTHPLVADLIQVELAVLVGDLETDRAVACWHDDRHRPQAVGCGHRRVLLRVVDEQGLAGDHG